MNQNRIDRQTGFTLVEMLVVIAILAILMAMMVPAVGLILRRAKNSTAQGDGAVVATVMQKYYTEYNRWPGFVATDPRHFTDDVWLATMNPAPGVESSDFNLKRIVFFEPGSGALGTETGFEGAFVDPWGRPYEYAVDLNRDGMIPHPTGETDDIRAKVIAWSAGPDQDYGTWEDNVGSWE